MIFLGLELLHLIAYHRILKIREDNGNMDLPKSKNSISIISIFENFIDSLGRTNIISTIAKDKQKKKEGIFF